MSGITELLSKDSAGMFGVTSLAVFLGHHYEVPTEVLWMVTALGLAYILGEKIRSAIQPKKPTPKKP